MENASKLLDDLVKALTPSSNALSETFTAYNNAIKILADALLKQFEKGVKHRIALEKKEKLNKQQNQN